MKELVRVCLAAAVAIAGISTVALEGQKGAKPSADRPATADISCPASGSCGMVSSGTLSAKMNGNNEMNLTLDGSQTITLLFNGQRPQGAANVADCTYPSSSCLWDWSLDPRTFSTAFQMQSNTLDALGESELSNGLLGVPADGVTEHKVRFNMTITVPETAPGFWRFDFNPNIPPDGGATLARVVRNDACNWTFTAAEGDLAALSILVKPPKGKQFAHREGRYAMPFVMTYHVPSLCQ
jgi:hypothetical protein